ncbi:MAG: deoxyribodipyrimidine photo-lyase [Steroidobacteraceae bacterium]
MKSSTAILWLRRDLRVADNPALAAARASAERVVPVYVHAPEEDGDWAPGAASRWWLHHSLARLGERLQRLGTPLLLRRGPTLEALLGLAREAGATRVHWNRRWEPAVAARDRAVAEGLEAGGLSVETSNASLFVEPPEPRTGGGGPYRVFTPYWRACLPRLDGLPAPVPAPARLAGVPGLSGLPLDELGLLPSIRWDAGLASAWTPGEAGAHARLESFCERALGDYADGRDRPDLDGVSRLSPHLHFGEIGPRQCLAAVRGQAGARPAVQRGADAFLRELGWREFAHHVLHHHPHTTTAPLDPRFRDFGWAPDERRLEAWRRGRTGYPLVDAGMRELWTTGWMHNRVRMVVASFLTKNLRQHWLEGARWFWDTLVDADLANNTLGWQWVAGCGADAAPYFRIFNPELQAGRHDPDGAYLRRWLTGTKPVPPVVDFRASRAAALDAYARLKR